MSKTPSSDTPLEFIADSPFHIGEQRVQHVLGVRDRMERFGRRVIRDYMPEQHREFYAQLPYVFLGHADPEGWPWASVLFGKPGFMHSPDRRHVHIDAEPVPGDPLSQSWGERMPVGLLGIELPTRRRNRLAATIIPSEDKTLKLEIQQAFGNCPQYIQARSLSWLHEDERPESQTASLSTLAPMHAKLIAESDTFFVASYLKKESSGASEGADVSHRGGKPGFVRVDNDKTLTIPDYLGNNHFNTFGNFIENGRAGLLFLDFERGHMLTLSGEAEILWDSAELRYFEGAQRLWRFRLHKGYFVKHALPVRWSFDSYSPNSLLTGTWKEADEAQSQERLKNQYLPYQVTRIVDESSSIKSVYLKPLKGSLFRFVPGQFLAVRATIDGESVVRTYSLSCAPGESEYRISVKREGSSTSDLPDGIFSRFVHESLQVGNQLELRSPAGTFCYDADEKRPAVLLAGGVGITPLVSMMHHAFLEGVRTRHMRSVTLFAAAKNSRERAFFSELANLQGQSEGQLRTIWCLSEVDNKALRAGVDYHHVGRFSAELFKAVLPLDDYDFYLCGPSGFMQHCYDLLLRLGVQDHRIHAEEFGPASLKRVQSAASEVFVPAPVASDALVKFKASGFDQAWTESDGTLLELAEAHGINPDFACRAGQCGACKTKLLSGKVSYQSELAIPVAEYEVLLCCAKPAATDSELPAVMIDI